MSASYVVDVRNGCDYQGSVNVGSGSNLIVGEIVDLLHANTFCNVYCAGGANSGIIQLQIQTADATTSGTFTDPTSGMDVDDLPPGVVSGGQVYFNSGLFASGNFSMTAPINNAPAFCSGSIQFAAFQRPHRYARLLTVSGGYTSYFAAGFVTQKRVTGSGGGQSQSPGSGVVNV